MQAARLTASGLNTQHWRFILIQDRKALEQLALDSTSGKWVANCDFAIIVLTDPKLFYHTIDAGRVLQDMQLAAWNYGVASRVFTGVNIESMRRDYGIPAEFSPTVIAGFGYPARKITGRRKARKPLEELAFIERFGNKFDKNALT
ncbi:MAG: nitroreductase family protein [Rhabdochlamydiaceae bacterium]